MTAIPTNYNWKNFGRYSSQGPGLGETLRDIADDIANLHSGGNSDAAGRVFHGGLVTAPTTPSAQLTGSGNTTWNVNVSACEAVVNSVDSPVAASADEGIHSGSNLLSAVGQACYAWVLLVESGGTVSISSVKGTAAAAASAAAPTDAQITAGVGHSNWIKLALCYIERTADTAVTQTQTNAGYGKPSATVLTTKA